MRLLFLSFVAVSLIGCSAAPVTEDAEIPVTGKASSGCINKQEWAYSANRGSDIYGDNCAYCHQRDGSGQGDEVPQLAGNDALLADPERGIRMMLITKSPATRSHGMQYEDMVAIFDDLSQRDIADVMTYVTSSWGNCAGPVTAAQVQAVSAEMGQ